MWQTPANPPQRHDYIFRDGIRYVRPYYFEFISHAKNRWAGKTIVDLFAEEFKGRPHDYYVSAVKAGRIQVDGQIVPVSEAPYFYVTSSYFHAFLKRVVFGSMVAVVQEMMALRLVEGSGYDLFQGSVEASARRGAAAVQRPTTIYTF
ncbi:unnamed protein product [Fraxinus pennsylvanica]|uniref:Uncharacterized protein n=1 Tax=Fraxinus pennsylvanica TaxID=56036 RepID=A0AAD1YSG1_9LAMI|nr:unnamed protein product [Fraxinus pennsylvanica]